MGKEEREHQQRGGGRNRKKEKNEISSVYVVIPLGIGKRGVEKSEVVSAQLFGNRLFEDKKGLKNVIWSGVGKLTGTDMHASDRPPEK